MAGNWSRPQLGKNRLKKLAESIDALADKDQAFITKTHEIAGLRRLAAADLHHIGRSFVDLINRHLSKTEVNFDPPDFTLESFNEEGLNLLQINARGRILQIEFQATDDMISTENFRVPHILEGSVRCFNQEKLEEAVIEEQFLFFCLEKKRNLWRFFDARTYRSGPFDEEYLISLMEQLI